MKLPIINRAGDWIGMADVNIDGYGSGDMVRIRFDLLMSSEDFLIHYTEDCAPILSQDVLARLMALDFGARGPFGTPLRTHVLLADEAAEKLYLNLSTSGRWRHG